VKLKLIEFAKSKNLMLNENSLHITFEKTDHINLFTKSLPDSFKRTDPEKKLE